MPGVAACWLHPRPDTRARVPAVERRPWRSTRPSARHSRGPCQLRPAARPPTGCSTTCVPSQTWRRAGRRVGLEMCGPDQTECSTIPSAPHLRPKYDEALRAGGRKFRVCCPFAPLGHTQRGSVNICAAWLRLARSRQRRNERGVAAQRDPVGRRPIDEQVQAATVCRLYAGSRRVCQPWLRDNVAFWSHCLARHSDPCPPYHFGSASEQTRPRAG